MGYEMEREKGVHAGGFGIMSVGKLICVVSMDVCISGKSK